MKVLTPSVLLKICVVSLLFTVFAWQFAHPSMMKFLSSDTIIVKTLGQKEPGDSPSVTFCVKDKFTTMGWKNKNKDEYDGKHPLQVYCKNATTVPAAMECIDEHTYSLNETIISNEYMTTRWGYLSTYDPLWIEDLELFYHGFVILLIKNHSSDSDAAMMLWFYC